MRNFFPNFIVLLSRWYAMHETELNMKRSFHVLLAFLIGMGGTACSSSMNGKKQAAAADPFVGFFANPSVGTLELNRGDGEGKYVGWVAVDFGPYPVELTREGNIAVGTVTYGGESHPMQVESTPEGLLLSGEGSAASPPLIRYKNIEAYKKWFEEQGGYQPTIEATGPETR